MRILLGDLTKRAHAPYAETEFAKALTRLPAVATSSPWVAGGCVRRLFAGTPQDSDFDFFFAGADQASSFDDQMETLGARLKSKNEKNTTWSLPASGDNPELTVQSVTFAYFSSMVALIDSFDFTICQFAFDGEVFEVGTFSLWDLARKRLVPGRISYGVSSVRRLMKYSRQGYTVCGGALADILEQVVENPSIIHAETQYID